MRILVLTNVPWSGDNATGNTFTNLFSGLPNVEIANIYTRYGMPDDNGVVSAYYQITDRDMLSGSPGRSFLAGQLPDPKSDQQQKSEKGSYDFFRKHRFMIFFWGRELIWKFGKWNTPELRAFVEEFKPDLIYLPIYDCTYLSDIGLFLKRYKRVNMIGCIWDDLYSLKQFHLSPLYWFDRFWKRRKIRKTVKQCEFLHVISDKQKREYEKALQIECRVIRKSMEFGEETRCRHELHTPVRYVYTGGIGNGRWKVLAEIGRTLDETGGQLFIYSGTPLNSSMEKALRPVSSIRMMGAVSYEECTRIQDEADVLVLVESNEPGPRLSTRLSLSTKTVEYLHTGNCILAVGPGDQAGIEYLRDGGAAVCVSDLKELKTEIRALTPDMIRSLGEAAWEFGKRNHNEDAVKERFYQDLRDAV